MPHPSQPPEKVAPVADDHEEIHQPNNAEQSRFKRLLGRLVRVSRSEIEERERLWRLGRRGDE